MKKKVILIAIAVVLMCAAYICGIVIYNSASDREFVKKGDAIELVIKAIGGNDDLALRYSYGIDYAFLPIADGGEELVRLGYLYCATTEHLIDSYEVKPYEYMLYPENNITFFELSQLIASCLQEQQDHATSYLHCVSQGIIKLSDGAFWKSGFSYVTNEELEMMIKRLRDCKRYRYFYRGRLARDDYNGMTYNEYFASEQYIWDNDGKSVPLITGK